MYRVKKINHEQENDRWATEKSKSTKKKFKFKMTKPKQGIIRLIIFH